MTGFEKIEISKACPLFDGTLQTTTTEWEEWAIGMGDAYC